LDDDTRHCECCDDEHKREFGYHGVLQSGFDGDTLD
jgi:hypothetical protein